MRRPLLLLALVGAALFALYSCSMQASVTTDSEGRIVKVSSLRIGSSMSGWVIELLLVGGPLAFELRSVRPAETRSEVDAEDVPGEPVSSLA